MEISVLAICLGHLLIGKKVAYRCHKLGKHTVRWIDTPHRPYAWNCGFLIEEQTVTLMCGDHFAQGGDGLPPLTESDILEPSEIFREKIDYFSHTINVEVAISIWPEAISENAELVIAKTYAAFSINRSSSEYGMARKIRLLRNWSVHDSHV